MNSCRHGFKKLVLGTTLMCCAGMSTVEAGPWDWLYENRGKVCLFVGVTGCVVAGCYYFSKKQPGTAENAIQIGETLIPLQQEEETPVLALEEEQGETQVQELNTAENKTRTENEAPVQPRAVLVIDEGQDFALCIEDAEKENRACKNWALLVCQERKAKVRKTVQEYLELQEVAKRAVNQVIQGALEKIGKRERACKNWKLVVLQMQKRENLKAALKTLQKDLTEAASAQLETSEKKNQELLANNTTLTETNKSLADSVAKLTETNRMLGVCTVARTQALLQIASSIKRLEGSAGVTNYINALVIQINQSQTSGAQRESSAGNNGQVITTIATKEDLASIGLVYNNQGGISEGANLQQVAKFEEQCGEDITQGVNQLCIAQQKLQQENKSLEEANEKSKKRVETLEQEKDKVEEENKQLSIEKQQAEQLALTKNSEVVQLNAQLLEAQSENKEVSQRVAELQNQNKVLAEENATNKSQVTQLQSEKDRLKAQLNSAETEGYKKGWNGFYDAVQNTGVVMPLTRNQIKGNFPRK